MPQRQPHDGKGGVQTKHQDDDPGLTHDSHPRAVTGLQTQCRHDGFSRIPAKVTK